MDQSAHPGPPYFDAAELRRELTGYWQEGLNEADLRARVLARLKAIRTDARRAAEQRLLADGHGRRCAEGLSALQDEIIRIVFDFAATHVYRAQNPSSAERMAIVATGGYGRGLMAPGSDVDLLFLLPYKQTPWGESIVEFILYFLWDLGLKVGHATRNIEQCLRFAKADMTIRTALLDARLIHGESALFEQLQQQFRQMIGKGSPRDFIEAKLNERAERHKRQGISRYRVEPNIKEGKGGLRDLHTLHWLASYLSPDRSEDEFAVSGLLSAAEARTYQRCEDFLWTVRCHLHFLAGKAEERLSFDVQPSMARRLNYKERGGLLAVERFMKHYFLIAKDVGDLTRIVSSSLEMKQLKQVPGLDSILSSLTWRTRAKLAATSSFRIENNRITVKHKEVFRDDPVNLIRLFAVAETYKVQLHPEAIRLARASLKLIDDNLRASREANRLFLHLLTSQRNSEVSLRNMNEAGVLGRFIPDFGRVVSMMQFNMYHHYTVDEHLIRTVGILSDIEQGRLSGELPLSTEIIGDIQNRNALYLAAFLHDVAKGREEDHSIAGARIAHELGPRLGLSPSETETAAWLIENHLVMSQFAQSRDISDPKTIRDFSAIVQTPERLKLLILLTVADIRAVGPGIWNGWKGQLLRALYYETEPVVAGGHTRLARSTQIASAKERLREALTGWPAEEVDALIARHGPAYWLRTDLKQMVAHADLLRQGVSPERPILYSASTDAFLAQTELTLLTKDNPRLLATLTGACTAAGANIVSAQISTTTDGMALDIITLQRAFPEDEEEIRRAGRIAELVESLISGRRSLDDLPITTRRPKPQLHAFKVPPQVVIDNSLSDEHSVIEVSALDRPGLLFDITSAMADLGLDISSAHIATFGEKAVDVFYVTAKGKRKITDTGQRDRIRNAIIERLS